MINIFYKIKHLLKFQIYFGQLCNNGYKVVTYDIRNHGESGKSNVNLDNILTNKDLAPKDLESIFKWLKLQPSIDSAKVAVIGTSIGASLALYLKLFPAVK
ncbi:MAG TPA: alpha/beta fold hydrolase [Ignavibacteria bacterium]